MKIVPAISGIPIRLTPERFEHIETRHPEMEGQEARILETLSSPDYVQQGDAGTLMALKLYSKTPLTREFCAVVHREIDNEDGFVLTAYFASKPSGWRRVVWKR